MSVAREEEGTRPNERINGWPPRVSITRAKLRASVASDSGQKTCPRGQLDDRQYSLTGPGTNRATADGRGVAGAVPDPQGERKRLGSARRHAGCPFGAIWKRLPLTCRAAYARLVGDPRALMKRLTAAQNAHDLEGMLACFHEDYRSEQPLFPARTFQGVDQVRANWSALLEAIPDFHAEILESALDGDIVFLEVHWTGTKADGAPLDERGVVVMGLRDDRVSWGRLYVDEVEREGADIDAVVRRMAGTDR
jgi:ketosteroid isomerase-like protein